MRYLITGGAGFIGSALTKRLLADGHQVRVLDSMIRGKSARLQDAFDCRIINGDVRDLETVTSAMEGADSVVHLAYVQGTQTFYTESRRVLDVAIKGMINVLTACEQLNVRELLLLSSSETYQAATIVPTPETIPLTVPDPLNPRYSYGGGKIACELMALAWQRSGVLDRLIIARPHNVFGPDMGNEHVIPQFSIRMKQLHGEQPSGIVEFPIQGSGDETRSFCYIDDCVDQLVFLLQHYDESGIYNVGTMDERTIRSVAEQVARLYNREIKIVPGTLLQGSTPRRLPDMSKMKALGWENGTSFTEGLEQTVDWYRIHR